MKIEVTQCSMCTHYNTEQYCEVWEQYISNDAFYCACGVKADRKTEPSIDIVRCKECKHWWETTGANYGDCEHFALDTIADAFCSYGEREGE